jgi:hypothetical protein
LEAPHEEPLFETAKPSCDVVIPTSDPHCSSDEEKLDVFVVMTNGLDYRTREAIQYWRNCGLDVRPWIYRVYAGGSDEFFLEIGPFRVSDDPYEDIAEGCYILNTNIRNDKVDHEDMLNQQKAAAFFDPWKLKIERLNKGDVVFLYQSGAGIVAYGEADGKLMKAPYQGDPSAADEEYSTKLRSFQRVSPPLTASEIKKVTGIDHRFMQTMFGLDAESGRAVRRFIVDSGRAQVP